MRRLLSLLFVLLMVITPLTVVAQEIQPLAASGGGYQTVYIVRYGDTLYGIARSYGVTPESIASANGIYNYNHIYVGQQLIIPSYVPPQPTYITHYVRRGETLASIARYYGTTVAAIAQLNNIYNVNRIYVGQALLVQQGYQPPPQYPQVVTYYVRYGDTLGRIARYYGVSIQSIISYNGIYNPNRIFAGTVLYVPLSTW